MIKPQTYRMLRKVHKYAGLAAALWLFVLGVTGVMLDHHEWRWLNQTSVPYEWSSERVAFLVPGTAIRHIATQDGRMVGASERGAWYSDDGKTWDPIAFEGMKGQPQTNGIVTVGGEGFANSWLATDDGLWTLGADGASADRAGLAGYHLTAITPGHSEGSLFVVSKKSHILEYDIETGSSRKVELGNSVSGLSPTVPLHRFVMDIHFGRALLPGNWSTRLNDLGGIALAVLSLSGVLYWFITRPGRRKRISMKTQRSLIRWFFRFHAPVIGIAGFIPILYLSLSALPMNHIYGFIGWAEGKTLDRDSLPAAYRMASLDHEIDGLVAWPGEPGRLSISTRYGVLESRDDGASWATDSSLPMEIGAPGANIFRVGDTVFAAFGGDDNFAQVRGADEWQKLAGTSTALTGGALDGDRLYLKNSKAIYAGSGIDAEFADTGIDYFAAARSTPLFLFIVDIHVGLVLHREFKWANDLFALLAFVLALSGPVMWLRRKWI